MLDIGGKFSDDNEDMPTVPLRTQLKIREFATVFATMVVSLDPDYDFSRSKLASSDLSITEIMCRAAVLSSALESIRRSSTSC